MTNNLTILLAEDDLRHAALITKALSRNTGVSKVIHFQNGREILDYLFANPSLMIEKYILLLDIQMPLVSGIHVLRKIKSHDVLKSLPVIMFSSITDPEIMDECYQIGCNAYIHKPLNNNELEEISMLNFLSVMQVPDIRMDLLDKSVSGATL